jgi:hypothetical protein
VYNSSSIGNEYTVRNISDKNYVPLHIIPSCAVCSYGLHIDAVFLDVPIAKLWMIDISVCFLGLSMVGFIFLGISVYFAQQEYARNQYIHGVFME